MRDVLDGAEVLLGEDGVGGERSCGRNLDGDDVRTMVLIWLSAD